jgi:hypothetical protein
MTSLTSGALAATILATQLATSSGVSAASAERSYQLETRIVEAAPSVGEYDGSLQLHVSSQGIVSGFYRPDDNPRFVPVTGGVTGDRFWLDIGIFGSHPARFSGTFLNGRIDAQSNAPILDDGRYTALQLTAAPKPV